MFTINIMNNVFNMVPIYRCWKIHILASILIYVIKRLMKLIHKHYIIMAFKFKPQV